MKTDSGMKWFPKGQSPSGWQLLNGTQEFWLQFWENVLFPEKEDGQWNIRKSCVWF